MARPCSWLRLLAAALSVALLTAAPASAQDLQSGDIIVPGNRVVDGFGSVHGGFYQLRAGAVTRLFESALYRGPKDMIIDSQGRLVFFASPYGGNANDFALYRLDPATATYERLYRFPYNVQPTDTLPNGASMITGFPYGSLNQSLHVEKSFGVTIDDDENGGWPQIQSAEAFGFAMMTSANSGQPPMTFRYRPADGTCEVGISTDLLPVTGTAPCMASDDDFIYYGVSKTIGRTGVPTRIEVHLDGDWGQFDASANLPPKNVLIITGNVFDNTRDPNVTVDCGSGNVDSDVPRNSSGAPFSALSMNGLGVHGGGLYVSANSVGTGTPYAFNLAPRGPYLNPFSCNWDTATKGTGMLGFSFNGMATYADRTSPDGDGLLAARNGVLMRTDFAGNFEVLDSSVPYTGRPWRWTGGSVQAAAPAPAVASAVAADSGAQVLMVRTDALAYVLLTDALGRRIGHDAAGNPVNDFGVSGHVLAGPGGWPRLILLRDPPNEVLSAEVAATGAGEWSVKGYLAHEDGGSLLAATSGTASAAGSVDRGLYVGQPTTLTWFADPVVGVGEPTGTESMGFVSVGPIPTRGDVRLAYRAPGNGARVRLEIFDVAGRLVTTPVNGFATGGLHTLSWSGVGPTGARLARGIYVARLDVNGRRQTRRIVLTD